MGGFHGGPFLTGKGLENTCIRRTGISACRFGQTLPLDFSDRQECPSARSAQRDTGVNSMRNTQSNKQDFVGEMQANRQQKPA
jgi:hypothetical protein